MYNRRNADIFTWLGNRAREFSERMNEEHKSFQEAEEAKKPKRTTRRIIR